MNQTESRMKKVGQKKKVINQLGECIKVSNWSVSLHPNLGDGPWSM